jgi:histidyl-tRNA synthetase
MPRPDVFVISAGGDAAEAELPRLVASLRRAGLHTRTSSRATKNVGKLLGDAGKARARLAVILGAELADGNVALKDLDAGSQQVVPLSDLAVRIKSARHA